MDVESNKITAKTNGKNEILDLTLGRFALLDASDDLGASAKLLRAAMLRESGLVPCTAIEPSRHESMAMLFCIYTRNSEPFESPRKYLALW